MIAAKPANKQVTRIFTVYRHQLNVVVQRPALDRQWAYADIWTRHTIIVIHASINKNAVVNQMQSRQQLRK